MSNQNKVAVTSTALACDTLAGDRTFHN